MQYRAINQRKAEWIGMAASVAGGYVATQGPRLAYLSPEEIHTMHSRIQQSEQYARCCAVAQPEPPQAEYLRECHQIDGGHGMLTIDERGDHLVLAMPDAHDPTDGIPVPDSLLPELREALRAAGYQAD